MGVRGRAGRTGTPATAVDLAEVPLRVADLMHPDVRGINPDARLGEAVLELADGHITALAVVTDAGEIIGVISTADLLQAQAEHEGGAWEELLVSDVMTSPALTVTPDDRVVDACQMMLYRDVHRVFVVRGGRLVGVISQTDLIRSLGSRIVPR